MTFIMPQALYTLTAAGNSRERKEDTNAAALMRKRGKVKSKIHDCFLNTFTPKVITDVTST